MRRSSEISALNVREKKAWKVIDYHLRLDTKVPAVVRQAAAEFILKRIYPEKRVLSGEGLDGEIIIKVEKMEPNGDQLQAPRFAIPDIQ